jgi:uncharacterized protein (DUF362 family)
MASENEKTRREFLSDVAKVAAGASAATLAGCFPDVGGEWAHLEEACMDTDPPVAPAASARVVEVHREDSVLTPPVRVQESAMRPMLEAALQALAQSEKPWPALLPGVTSATRVGIKVNCLNPDCPTHPPLIKALVESLKEAFGLNAEHIIVWDRTLAELTRGGYTSDSVGATVMGTSAQSGGPGYSNRICGMVAGKSPRLSKILTELTDVTINVPVLKTHGVSGVTAGFKNIYGIIDNPEAYHTNLATALPLLYALPPIRNHIKLTLIDALIAVVTGDTSSSPDVIPRRLIAATDPLAADTHAVALVNEMRATKNVTQLGEDSVPWIAGAAKLGLGSQRFELAKIAS